jgi:hypothetical protein
MEIAPLIIRPEIPLENFFPIFLSSAMVIILGLGYIGIYTIVRLGKLHKSFMPVAYAFWVAQTYCLYYLGVLIKSEPFTQYVLFGAMVGFLLIPHFVYFLMVKTHESVEH